MCDKAGKTMHMKSVQAKGSTATEQQAKDFILCFI
jgi:hypothetical protein